MWQSCLTAPKEGESSGVLPSIHVEKALCGSVGDRRNAPHPVALWASVLTEAFAWEAAGQVHCGMAGLLSVDSKVQGRV